jgi:hypothetical protein
MEGLKMFKYLLIFTFFGFPALSQFKDGSELYYQCTNDSFNSDRSLSDQAVCIGYIVGVADAYDQVLTPYGYKFCLPRNVVPGQLMDIVKNYLSRYPQERHYTAASIIASVLEGSFPCR